MKIEVLFPEVCNLYGDLSNIRYLKRCQPDLEIVNTSLKAEPLFARETPDLIYMGAMTEKSQELVLEKLLPYRDRIAALIEQDAFFLITGNAFEIFGSKIVDEAERLEIPALGLYDTVAKRRMMNRFNSLYLADFEDMKIVGYKSQFTHSYGDNSQCALFQTIRGCGINPDTMAEGVRMHRFLATYIIGPLLILNPDLAKWTLRQMGVAEPKLAFEAEIYEAYEIRLREYSDKKTGFTYH